MGNTIEKCLISDKKNSNTDILVNSHPQAKRPISRSSQKISNNSQTEQNRTQTFSPNLIQSPKVVTVQITDQGNKVKGFLSGKTIDEGIIEYTNGNHFKGAIWEGMAHGNGQMKYNNGNFYHGRFANDKREGDGVLRYANGNIYRGGFRNDLFDGEGYFKSYNGDIYKGM